MTERFPKLGDVRLTAADWRRESHRSLAGLAENVRGLEAFAIDLLDFEGALWWEEERDSSGREIRDGSDGESGDEEGSDEEMEMEE